MTPASPHPEQIRSHLVQVYRKLPLLEQVMVQLSSVIYEPTSRALFLNCLNYLNENDRGGKHFTASTIKPYIDRLIERGVLTQAGGAGPQCNPLLAEIATRDAVKANRFERLVEAVQKGFPVPRRWKDGPVSFGNDRQLIREIRVGVYRKDLKFINKQLEDYYRYSYQKEKLSLDDIYQQICNNPFDPEWFRTLPSELYEGALISILNYSILELTSADAAVALLESDVASGGKNAKQNVVLQRVVLTEQWLLRGRLPEAQQLLERVPEDYQHQFASLRGHLAFLQGDDATAIAQYSTALRALKQGTGKRKVYFQSMSGLFFILALLKDGTADRLEEAAEYTSIARQAKHWLSPTYAVLENVIKVQQGDLGKKAWVSQMPIATHKAGNSLQTLIACLCLYWVDLDQAKKHLPRLLEPFYDDAAAAGYLWMAKTIGELLVKFKPRSPYGKQAAALLPDSNLRSLADLIQPQEAWELSLNALSHLRKDQPQAVAKTDTTQRLAWFITFYPTSGCVLQPREQTLNAKGEWSKGRPIALKRLKSNAEEFGYLTPQDLRLCAQIKTYAYGWGNKTDYTFTDKAIALLVGHPHVFWEDAPTTRVEVVKGEPELLVKKIKDDRLALQFSPALQDNKEILTVKESPTRLKIIDITPEHRRIAEILGTQNRLEVPAAAKERVLGCHSCRCPALSRCIPTLGAAWLRKRCLLIPNRTFTCCLLAVG
jgi:hypothetical protein